MSLRASLCAVLVVFAVSGCAGVQPTLPMPTATHGADDPPSTVALSPTMGSVPSPTATSTPPPLEPLEMSLAWQYPTNDMVWSLASADLDNDGGQEVVAGSYDKHVYALDEDGALLWRHALGAAVYCLDTGDLDGDGVEEVVAGGDDNWVHALGPAGQLLWEWYVGSRVVSLHVEDVDGDGEEEVVAGSWDGQLLLLESDGKLGWSLVGDEGVSVVECTDLDEDGCVEVLAAHREGAVSLVSCDGVQRWSYPTGGYVREMATGDMDGNGALEIAVGSADGWAYVLSGEGQLRWKTEVGDPVTSVVAADADGDGRSEVVVGTGPHHPQILMLSDRGEQRWSFDTQKSVWSVRMADLDADGVLDILAGGDDGSVYVLDVYGRQRGSYQTNGRVHGLATVGGQGSEFLDVLARSGNDVYLLNLALGEAATPAVPGDGEPETVVEWMEPPERETVDEEGLIELVAVGDVLLSRTVEERMEVFGSEYPFEVVASLLREADLAIGNLESPFSLGGDPLAKRFTFRTHPGHAEALAWAGFDVLSLANNHVMDFGEESLVQTMDALRAAGLAYVGAGPSYEEAHQPLVMEVKGKRIAFLAYAATRWKGSYELPTDELVAFADPLTIGEDVTRAKEQADLVVVILHLGTEYQAYPDTEQLAVSRAAIEAGASLVLGHHPHVVQGTEEYGDGFVAYSLGNFVFDIDMESTREGAILRVLLGKQGVQRVESIPVRIVDDVQPQFLKGEDGLPIVERLF